MSDNASRRGAVDLGLPLMIVAFLAIGGFLYWLNLQAKAELAEKEAVAAEIRAEEALAEARGDIISAEGLQADPGVFSGKTVTVEGLMVASLLGTQGFWMELPNKNPFLVSFSEAVKAEGVTVNAGGYVTVTGRIYTMGDSVINAWSTAASIGEGDRLAAEFATHYLEASMIETGVEPAAPTGGEG